MAKILKFVVLLPVAVLLLVFAIANRSVVTVSFDPFATADTSATIITAPLFAVLFLTLMIGVLIGGIATWFTQGVNRRRARVARDEAERWQDEAVRLRDQQGAAGTPNRLMIR